MRITVVYDTEGNIIAAAPADPHYTGPVPVASGGTERGEFDVPDSAAEKRLDEICAGFRVHTDENRLIHRREAGA
jgi:hypothetical protein